MNWQEHMGRTFELMLHDGTALVRLTDDSREDVGAEVSPDGSLVTWWKCEDLTRTACRLWTASRDAAGGWISQQHPASPLTRDPRLSTNGTLIAWSDPASDGQLVRWLPLTGGPEQHFDSGGTLERNPAIGGNLIAYERAVGDAGHTDIYVYDVGTGIAYQITDTPDNSEFGPDISLGADGNAYLTWLSRTSSGDLLQAFSFTPQTRYQATTTLQQDRSYKLGSVIPLRLQLFDRNGQNISSPTIVVTVGLVQRDSTAPPIEADSVGNAYPDGNFRYDPGVQGYAFNLSSRGLSAGTWDLMFTVSGDASVYRLTFNVR